MPSKGRYTGTYFNRGSRGNSGRSWNTRARKSLALLDGRMDTTGQNFSVNRSSFAEGMRQKEVIIKTPGLPPIYLVRRRLSEAIRAILKQEIYSGVFSVYPFTAAVSPVIDNVVTDFQFLSGNSEDGWSRSAFDSSNKFNNHFLTAGSGFSEWPLSLVHQKSGWYSGTMRRVVQLLAGQNAEIPYKFGWPTTHGIFINQQTKIPWVIEISSAGITAWKLPLIDELAPELQAALVTDLDFIPKKSRSLPAASSRIELATAEDVEDAYEGSPLSVELGWAFNLSGTEAQHVVVKGGFISGSYTYNKSFRYKVAISEDMNGDPVSATLSEEDSNWFWSNHLDANIRVPKRVECGFAQVRVTMVDVSTPVPPTASDITFPLHVFYTGDTAQIFNYTYLATATVSVPKNSPPADQYAGCGFTYSRTAGDAQLNQDYTTQARTETRSGANISNVSGAKTGFTKYSYSTLSLRNYEIIYEDNNVWIPTRYWPNSTYLYRGASMIRGRNYVNPVVSRVHSWSFVVPFFDREAYYFYTRDKEDISYSSYTEGKWLVARNEWWSPVGRSWNWAYNTNPSWDCGYTGYMWRTIVDCTINPSDPDCSGATPDCEDVAYYQGEWNNFPDESGFNWVGLGEGFAIDLLADDYISCAEDKTSLPCPQYRHILLFPVQQAYANGTYPNWCGQFTNSTPGSVQKESLSAEFFYSNDIGLTSLVVDESDTPLDGTISEDNSSCIGGSPWWVGSVRDAFTDNGWCSANPEAELVDGERNFFGSSISLYDWDNQPATNLVTGFFGSPYPEDVNTDN